MFVKCGSRMDAERFSRVVRCSEPASEYASVVEGERATIIIRRTLARGMKVRSLDVSVNGRFWVDLPFGGVAQKEFPPGTLLVGVTNRLFSKKEAFDVRAGETLVVEVGNRMGGCGMVFTGLGLPLYGVFIERQSVESTV